MIASTACRVAGGVAGNNRTRRTFPGVVAIGCTGGKHRSVAIADALAQLIESEGSEAQLSVRVLHRDLGRE